MQRTERVVLVEIECRGDASRECGHKFGGMQNFTPHVDQPSREGHEFGHRRQASFTDESQTLLNVAQTLERRVKVGNDDPQPPQINIAFASARVRAANKCEELSVSLSERLIS